MKRTPKLESKIVAFFHCRKCLDSLPAGRSPRDWASLEVGFTKRGLQVWCKRHELNVIHIDFEGHRHPADLSERGDFSNSGPA